MIFRQAVDATQDKQRNNGYGKNPAPRRTTGSDEQGDHRRTDRGDERMVQGKALLSL